MIELNNFYLRDGVILEDNEYKIILDFKKIVMQKKYLNQCLSLWWELIITIKHY